MNLRSRFTPALLVAACLLAAGVLPAAAAQPQRSTAAATATGVPAVRSAPMLGSEFRIEAEARADVQDTSLAARGAAAGLAEAVRWSALLEPGDPESELSRLTRVAGDDRFPCSPELFAVLDTARSIAEQTDGTFDPTCGALVKAWDLRGEGRVPTTPEVSDARLLTGWRMLVLEPGRRTARFTKPGMSLALDGVDRGFVLDRVVEVLRVSGIKRARLQLGEVVLAMSPREAYGAAVEDPTEPGREVFHFVLANGALSTATQAGRGFDARGTHYGPVLDPRRGAPVPGLASVTVVARNATRAQSLARALLVMGREDALAFAEGHPDIGVLWLEHDGQTLQAWGSHLTSFTAEEDAPVRWMSH